MYVHLLVCYLNYKMHGATIKIVPSFRLVKTIYVHLLVCYLNKLHNARCNNKDSSSRYFNTGEMCSKLLSPHIFY